MWVGEGRPKLGSLRNLCLSSSKAATGPKHLNDRRNEQTDQAWIHSTHLFSTYYISGIGLGAGDTTTNRTDGSLPLWSLESCGGGIPKSKWTNSQNWWSAFTKHLLCQILPSQMILSSKIYYYSHFRENENEAQKVGPMSQHLVNGKARVLTSTICYRMNNHQTLKQ